MRPDTVTTLYVVCASALSLNLLWLAGMTGYLRTKVGLFVNPEDTKLSPNGKLVPADDETVARYGRAHRNALENIPTFLIMGFLLLLTGPSAWVAALLYGTFTAARWVHSVAYVKSLQPLRSVSFGIGTFAFTGVIVTLLVKVLTA